MNKFSSLASLFVLLSNFSYGQHHWGVKAGLNISNVSNADKYDFSSLPGYNLGIVYRLKINDNIWANTEALVSNKGFNSILIPSGTTANRLSYLSFPLLLHYLPADKFYLQAGPEFNFLMKAKMKNNTLNKNIADEYKRFDCSFAGGLGFKISRKFNIESRYSFGLSQIVRDADAGYKLRTLQVNLIYLLKNN